MDLGDTMERKEISLHMSMIDVAVVMSEGNPGALTVICNMLKHPDGLFHLLHLDDMNIRGTQIWIGYKYYCDELLDEFVKCVIARDKEMIAKINELNMLQGDDWKAIPHGASSGKRSKFEVKELDHEY
jgi:hypothetical protein